MGESMKKLFLILTAFLCLNAFSFAEEYHFHHNDKKGSIRIISVIISEENDDSVSGFYREECFFEKKNLNAEFTAYKKNDKYNFTVTKDNKTKTIEFTYDKNYLNYEAKVTGKNQEEPLFVNFKCRLTSLTARAKESDLYAHIQLETSNQSIIDQFYKIEGWDKFTPYVMGPKVPDTVQIKDKTITFAKNTKWEASETNPYLVYSFYYSKTEKYTGYYIIFDLSNPNDIKSYTLKTVTFDTKPMILNVNSQIVFLQTSYNTDEKIESDFVTKPYLLTSDGFKLLDCPDDYFYFNISEIRSTNIRILKTMKYTKNRFLSTGLPVSLKILDQKSYKSETKGVYNNFTVISGDNDKDLRLVIFRNEKYIGYYNIPCIPTFEKNTVIFNRETFKRETIGKSVVTTTKEEESKIDFFDGTFPTLKIFGEEYELQF